MKPLILLTNDDGINSPGLWAMAEAVQEIADFLIVAPAYQQTSMGRAFPRTESLGIISPRKMCVNGASVTGYAVYGSPAYAVTYGILEVADRKPDLCLSGVNYGENLGTNLTCSGTVGAILEASTYQVPGIAISIPAEIGIQRSSKYPEMQWDKIKKIVVYWAEKLLKEQVIYGTSWLNINIPDPIPDPDVFCYTRQSHQNFFESVKPGKRYWSQPFELSTVRKIQEELAPKDDIYVFSIQKMTSVTPIVHDLTVPELR